MDSHGRRGAARAHPARANDGARANTCRQSRHGPRRRFSPSGKPARVGRPASLVQHPQHQLQQPTVSCPALCFRHSRACLPQRNFPGDILERHVVSFPSHPRLPPMEGGRIFHPGIQCLRSRSSLDKNASMAIGKRRNMKIDTDTCPRRTATAIQRMIWRPSRRTECALTEDSQFAKSIRITLP